MGVRVCIDGSIATRRYNGAGAHRYLRSLLPEMERVTRGSEQVRFQVLIPSLAEIEPVPVAQRPGFEWVACPLMRLRQVWKVGQMFTLAANRLKADVAFLPFPAPVYFNGAPLVVTIHDVIPLLFPADFKSPAGLFLQHCFRTSLNRADLILTDSEYSKSDMVSRLGVPAERVVVTYAGFDRGLFGPPSGGPRPEAAALARGSVNRPYILHVGTLQPRKNVVRLVQAYRALRARRKDLDCQLVICGPVAPGSEDVLHLLAEPELRGRVVATGAVPDPDLAALYRGASCYAMPSLYEGFGLPVLEAMASGCPVMSSNRSCLPEIAADAALYFDPESVEEISLAMERLLSDSALRECLSERGLERAKQFSWENCARRTLRALNNL